MIINAGSRIPSELPNTYEEAVKKAERWLSNIHEGGWPEVEMRAVDEDPVDGRWKFEFTHRVTGVSRILETHGITDQAVNAAKLIACPRIYWNGCSSSEPKPDDWLHDDYVWRYQYVKRLK